MQYSENLSVLGEKENIQPYKKVRKHLKENGISITFLAKKINLHPRYLSYCLSGVFPLSDDSRQKINEWFKTDY